MKKLDQFYKLHHILDARRTPIGVAELARRLECSERTVRRYIEEFHTYWNAPLEHIDRQGWRYDPDQRERWEVPGLWMTAEESQSLLLLLDILGRFGNGLLNEEFSAVRRSIDETLAKRGISRSELEARIRIIPIGQRFVPNERVQQALTSIVSKKRLYLKYRDYEGRRSTRTVSPQRVVYYRDNWYLDAFCHRSDGLRTFSLARIERADLTDQDAELLTSEDLDREFTGSYGVFAGEAAEVAKLRFLPAIAAEIARQEWHPDQVGRWEGDDYILMIPYSDPRELVQDIFRHLPNVTVLAPASLREAVLARLRASLEVYEFTG